MFRMNAIDGACGMRYR